eukprot:13502440-Heterocapsa_arctica.AAC.1
MLAQDLQPSRFNRPPSRGGPRPGRFKPFRITPQGAMQKDYKEYVEWCDDAAKNPKFEIKTATPTKEKLIQYPEEGEIDVGFSKIVME